MSNCNFQRRRFSTLLALGIGASITLCGAIEHAALAQPQPVEIVYATFLDPNNQNDPRAAAQTRMIAAFEKANPNIKVRVQVDPTQQASLRALRSRSATPDLFRVANFSLPEFVATNSMVQLDDLLKRDNVSDSDWLIPLSAGKVNGHVYGMQQDYRIPLLLYRKKLLQQAGVSPPKTWAEVCQVGRKLSTESLEKVRKNCPQAPDFQIVIGDGLSTTALAAQVPSLLPLLIDGAKQRSHSGSGAQ